MTPPVVVFVHLGENPTPTLVHFARVVKTRLPNADVVLITDLPGSHRAFPGRLIEYQNGIVPESIAVIRRRFPERKQLAGGYWIHTLERLFALLQLQADLDDSPILHIESDVLLSVTQEHLVALNRYCRRTSVPRYSSDMGIASLLYSPSMEQLHHDLGVLENILVQNINLGGKFLTDMQLLGLALNSGALQELPTLPEKAWGLGEMTENRKLVFDGAAYGQYLFGRDPVHSSGMRMSGHQNEFFPHQLSTFDWSLRQSRDGLFTAGFMWDGSHFEIACFHIHSKEIVELPHFGSARWTRAVDEANGLCERKATGPHPDHIHSQRVSFLNQIRLSRRNGKIRFLLDVLRRRKLSN